jgi:glutathione S-transferase
MILFHSPNSPYARRVRVAVREFGLSDRVEEQNVSPLAAPDNVLHRHGPGAKVPGLLTDGGVFLCETLVICHYLDGISGGRFYPADPTARERCLQIEGVASLLMDSLFFRAHENRRAAGEQSPAVIDKEAARAARAYDALEDLAAGFGDELDMSLISVAAALGYADGRHPGDNWRGGRPTLAAWFEAMMQRPALAETVPNFD